MTLALVVGATTLPRYVREARELERLGSEDRQERAEAIRALAAMRSHRAVPHLCAILETFDEPEFRPIAFSALSVVDLEPEPPFVDLAGPALRALRVLAPPAETLVPSILRAAEVGNCNIQLGGCGSGVSDDNADTECVKALVESAAERFDLLLDGVRSDDGNVAFIAALAVGRLRANGKRCPQEAVEVLLARSEDEDEALRSAISWALGQFQPEAFPALFAAAQTNTFRGRAADGAFAVAGPAAVPFLRKALRGKDPSVRRTAVRLLRGIGEAANSATAQLVEALRSDPDLDVRRAAAHTLHEVGGPADAVVPVLVKALDDPAVREAAIGALAAYGSAAGVAAPRLVDLLKRSESSVELKASVVRALSQTGGLDAEAVEVLVGIVKSDPPRPLFRAAAEALLPVSVAATELVPVLVRVLERGDDPTRDPHAAMKLLAAIGPAARDAVPVLMRRLNDPDEFWRRAAAKALGAIGDRRAIPALERAAQGSDDSLLQSAATEAIRRLREE